MPEVVRGDGVGSDCGLRAPRWRGHRWLPRGLAPGQREDVGFYLIHLAQVEAQHAGGVHVRRRNAPLLAGGDGPRICTPGQRHAWSVPAQLRLWHPPAAVC